MVQNQNVEIIASLATLRCLSDVFKEGGKLRCSVGQEIDMIISMIGDAQGALYNITSYRDEGWEFYENDLSYQDVKKLKITKHMLYSSFRDPSTCIVLSMSRAHIAIDWCIEPSIKENWIP